MKIAGFSQGFIFHIIAIIFFGLFSSSTGFKCYVCNSAFQKDCGDKRVPAQYLVECTPSNAHALSPPSCHDRYRLERAHNNKNMASESKSGGRDHHHLLMDRFSIPRDANFTTCRKQVYTIPAQTNGDTSMPRVTRVARSCGYIEKERTGCKRTDRFGNLNLFCQCTKDSCNDASGKSSHTFIMFITLFLFAGCVSGN